MSNELKIAQKYCKAINKDLWSLRYNNNSPRSIEIRNDIIPRALTWINGRLWGDYYLYVEDNYCFIRVRSKDHLLL